MHPHQRVSPGSEEGLEQEIGREEIQEPICVGDRKHNMGEVQGRVSLVCHIGKSNGFGGELCVKRPMRNEQLTLLREMVGF